MKAIAKIKTQTDDGEFEIIGNREGLKWLANICRKLSELSDAEAKTPANHYHIAHYMSNAEEGSVPLVIVCDPDL